MLESTWKSRLGSRWGFAALASVGLCLTAAAGAEPARAQGTSNAAPTKPSEAPLPSCLAPTLADELRTTLRPRGVQEREFLKDKQLVVIARGGVFAADLLSTSYLYGGALEFFFTEDLGVQLSFDVTPLDLDLDSPLAEFFGDDRFEPGTGYLALASLVWSPIHAKVKMAGTILHSDIMLVAGAGRLFHDSVQGVTFDAGAILELYTTSWVTLRLELRDIIAVQEAIAETRLTNNIVATLGFALWLPTGLR